MYNDELYHHGVKGMKWGVRKEKDTPDKKSKTHNSKAVKIGIGIAAAGLAVYGGYRLKKDMDVKISQLSLQTGMEFSDRFFRENRRTSLGATPYQHHVYTLSQSLTKEAADLLGSKAADNIANQKGLNRIKTYKYAINVSKGKNFALDYFDYNAFKNVVYDEEKVFSGGQSHLARLLRDVNNLR